MKCSYFGPAVDQAVLRGSSHSNLLRDTDVETTTRAELGREHANAGPVPDFVDLVEDLTTSNRTASIGGGAAGVLRRRRG
jgi:hypothetical protein